MQHELQRQNKITEHILEAFIQKKLGLKSNIPKAPSILDILPVKMPTLKTTRQPEKVEEDLEEEDTEDVGDVEEEDFGDREQDDQDNIDNQELREEHELREDDSLQSVESEQIDSIYNTQGRYHDSRLNLAISSCYRGFAVTEWIALCKLHTLFKLGYVYFLTLTRYYWTFYNKFDVTILFLR